MVQKIKYLIQDVDRHGNIRTYVRKPRCRKVRIYEKLGTAEFWKLYHEAIHGLLEDHLAPRDGYFVYVVTGRTRPVKIGICKKPRARD